VTVDRFECMARVDAALAAWRQGDCVVEGKHSFVHRLDIDCPVTHAAEVAAAGGADLASQEIVGFVVVSQTCDAVRSCQDRPFIEI